MRLMYIKYTGDFSEAYRRLIVSNGSENYYGQNYTVSTVVEQARSGIETLVLVIHSEGYNDNLENNLKSIGLTEQEAADQKHIKNLISNFNPNRVVLSYPDHAILKFLRKSKIPTFPVFADSFDSVSILRVKGYINKLLLSHELKTEHIKWIANHQINAAKSIVNLGVKSSKVIPYDWEHSSTPDDWTKNASSKNNTDPIKIFYAGSLSLDKGFKDLLSAVKIVKEKGRNISLTFAGRVNNVDFKSIASEWNLENEINYIGLVSHDDVLKNMNEATLVCVPSHHVYPEGLPMTIMESLMTHTPVIASNHPMFVGRVGKRGAVRFFPEKNISALADSILELCENLDEYILASKNCPKEWHDLCLKAKWADLINTWIKDESNSDFTKLSLSTIL